MQMNEKNSHSVTNEWNGKKNMGDNLDKMDWIRMGTIKSNAGSIFNWHSRVGCFVFVFVFVSSVSTKFNV